MIWKYIFNIRFFIILLVALSLPCWLFLRSWYGARFFWVLVAATILYIPALYIFLVPLVFVETVVTGGEAFTAVFMESHQSFFWLYVYYGVLVQIPLAFISIIRNSSGFWPKANPGYAGNVVFWPSSFPRIPLDVVILALIAYGFYSGEITIYEVRELFIKANSIIEPLGFGAPAIPDITAFNHSFIVTIVSYVIVVILISNNHGLLPYFDVGPKPERLPKKPLKPLIARIYKKAGQPNDTLEGVFSRRDPALKVISDQKV